MQRNTKQVYKKGDVLMRQGEQGDCAYVIESGNVEILVAQEGQLIQIGTRGPGSLIGEMAMIDDQPRTATVRALDDCAVMRISREDFSRRVETADPVLKMAVHVILTRYRDLIARTQLVRFPHEGAPKAEAMENMNETHDIALSAIKIHNELTAALARDELTLHYQPIIDLRQMKIAGFEALMRWKHPEKGMISPGIFIPVAEESGLIVEMSRWALAVSCDAVKAFRVAADPQRVVQGEPLFVSVNFSVKDFMAGDLFEHIRGVLNEKSVSPRHIHMEITESLLMETPERAKAALEKCRDFGLGVSIDDFGSGYSSLSYLHYFPIDTLKIDQSFIRSMVSHEASLVLVRSIIGLARNLNMRVIAEGIESEEEARIVRDLGCEQCQGFWFARPMPEAAALDFLRDWKPPVIK